MAWSELNGMEVSSREKATNLVCERMCSWEDTRVEDKYF